MLHISQSQINAWDSWYPATWTSCQVCISLCLSSCHPAQSKVTSAGALMMLMAPYPLLSPEPKPNNMPWSLCHLSLHCCPSAQWRWAAALPWRWQGLCLSPSLTHRGTEVTGNAHARCHRKQHRRPMGEIWDREKNGGGKKLRKGKGN